MKNLKTYKLIIVFFAVCNCLFSQSNVYKPFPQIYGRWLVHLNGPLGPFTGSVNSWKEYIAFGDTVIGSTTYKKVTVADNTGYPTWNGTTYVIPFGPATFDFAYRNDIANKKVYMNLGVNHDTLWYDFNLTVGDTIKETGAYKDIYSPPSNPRRIVQFIDSVALCGTYFKRFNVCSGWGGGFETQLIEGMGFLDNFKHTLYYDCPFEPTEIDHTDFTCTITGIHSINELSENIDLYPNPVTSDLKVNSLTVFDKYEVVNELGEVVLHDRFSQNQSLDTRSLSPGLYILKLSDEAENTYKSKFIKQ